MIENLDVFFSGLDSTEAVFSFDGKTRRVKGFFDNGFFDVSAGETVLATTQPRFTAKFSDLKGIPEEALAVVAGEKYSVITVEPEGTGTAVVTLAHE